MVTVHLICLSLWLFVTILIGVNTLRPKKFATSTAILFQLIATTSFDAVMATLLFILYKFETNHKLAKQQSEEVKPISMQTVRVASNKERFKPQLIAMSEQNETEVSEVEVENSIFDQFVARS